MEFRDYLRIYARARWLILAIMIVAVGTAVAAAAWQPTQKSVSVSFAINRVNKETTPDYQFDGYYALQASDLFAQTVVSWFSTPSVLQEVYTKAAIDPDLTTAESLVSRFKVKKYSAQNIVVRFSESTTDRAQKMAAALKSVMESQASALNQNSAGKSLFAIVGQTPVITDSRPNIALIAAATAVLSLLLGLFTATARHYLKS